MRGISMVLNREIGRHDIASAAHMLHPRFGDVDVVRRVLLSGRATSRGTARQIGLVPQGAFHRLGFFRPYTGGAYRGPGEEQARQEERAGGNGTGFLVGRPGLVRRRICPGHAQILQTTLHFPSPHAQHHTREPTRDFCEGVLYNTLLSRIFHATPRMAGSGNSAAGYPHPWRRLPLRCPFCNDAETQVKDSRPAEDGTSIRRRRACPTCGQRFTTVERVQLRELIVVKADGRRAPFEREKLARSIRIALRKRPVSEEQIEHIVSGIVRRLEASGEGEIATTLIGQLAMEALQTVDAVAYVRFASVYRDFRETQDFSEILTSLDDHRRAAK